ncbi:uncharacterized protein PAC_09294 [Phialocephala subalpina]|uniref:Uncharacterized protein n=1 Tax=Phialocephala subalpina TaxID=576137 RepID=A0A1L7X2Y4_9HELO|nr:uncharacterized protein PAC_09294 [Phialocephala subalpina]
MPAASRTVKSIISKTLSIVKAQDNANVFGKVGTNGAEFQKALTGKKVISAICKEDEKQARPCQGPPPGSSKHQWNWKLGRTLANFPKSGCSIIAGGKGKKDAPTSLPNGQKITFLTVGGRTSCVVPSVQKKTGAVAGDLKKENLENLEKGEESEAMKPARGKAKAKKVKEETEEDEKVKVEEDQPLAKSNGTSSRKRKNPAAIEEPEFVVSAPPPKEKKRPWTKAAPAEPTASKASKAKVDDTPSTSNRRSGRTKK